MRGVQDVIQDIWGGGGGYFVMTTPTLNIPFIISNANSMLLQKKKKSPPPTLDNLCGLVVCLFFYSWNCNSGEVVQSIEVD